MSDQVTKLTRIARIAKAVETEAQTLMEQGNYKAANALLELATQPNGDTLLRFADIITGTERVA